MSNYTYVAGETGETVAVSYSRDDEKLVHKWSARCGDWAFFAAGGFGYTPEDLRAKLNELLKDEGLA